MKKNRLSIILVVAAVAFMPCCNSCVKDDPSSDDKEDVKDDPDPVPEGPQAGTYTFTASPFMEKWNVGDKIYVHGSYGPAGQMITLAASDISADGRTASVTLDKVLEFCLGPDNLYAAWPGDAVLLNDGIMTQSTEFETLDAPLAVAYLSGTDFAFVDASACLTFKVSGYKDFALAGNQRPGLRFTGYEALHTSAETDFFGRKVDGYPFIYGDVKDGSVTLWLPGTITFKSGFTLYFGNDGNWPVCYSIKDDIRLTAGKIEDLGDITAALETYSGPAPKMPEMGARTKWSIKVNELSGLCMSADGDFIWGLGDGGDLVRLSFDAEVLSSVHIGGDAEAISIDPATGDLIVGCEPSLIYKVPYPDFNKMEQLYVVEDARLYGNDGQEGLTYYRDGLIYSGMQTGSELYCIVYETGEVVWKKNMRQIFPSITEIADLEYDPLTDWLWIIDSEAKKIFALTGDAENMLGSYAIKATSNPESLCVDHAHSCIWVGDDYGSTSYFYKYEFTGLDDAIIQPE